MPQTRLLPTVAEQADRLIALGVADLAGLDPSTLRSQAQVVDVDGLLVLNPPAMRVADLAPLLSRADKPGFVVSDMTDVDAFQPVPQALSPGPLYLVTGLDRGDHLANWSPNEALPELLSHDRTPLTLTEGIFWLLQRPELLQPNQCFMTIGSRLRKPNGQLDSRVPALWISGGTGRDGAARKGAPKVGWCWAGNRHTWLGFASAEARVPL